MSSRLRRVTHLVDLAGRGALSSIVIALTGCDNPSEPLPQPFPPNIRIRVEPAAGSTVDLAAADSVVLTFDRPMDPSSLGVVRRMSFLLPLSIADLDGRWNQDHTRVVFELTQYPVQPGAHYEATFNGLRTAAGELYNLGPYRVHFRTRGIPDLMPVTPDAALEPRTFCHQRDPESTACEARSTLRIETVGSDSLWIRWDGDNGDATGELYRRSPRNLEWLGFETGAGESRRRVLWPEPVPLCNLPAVRGTRATAAWRVAADGTRLDAWQASVAAPESPSHTIRVGGLAVQLAFTDATVLDITYDLTPPGEIAAQHRERWWLYPGVGLVRREIRVRRGDVETFELRRFAPGLPD